MMEKVLNFVKNERIKIAIIIVLLIVVAIGVCIFLNYKNKGYDLTEVSEYKYYVLNENNKYGIIDTSVNIIIEPIYDDVKIPNPEKPIFICKNADKSVILNKNQEELFSEYEEVSAISINGIVSSIPYEKTVLKYKRDGKYGIVSYEGKEITNSIYEEIKGLENKESELLVKKDGKYGVINVKGATLIESKYDNIVADGFYTDKDKYGLSGYIISNKTAQGYRYGYINYKHKNVLEVEYNSIDRLLQNDFQEDIYLIACKNGQYGVVKNNKVLINYSYQGIEYDSSNKIFELQRNGKNGIVNLDGKEIIPVEYNEIAINGIYIEALKTGEEEPTYYSILGEKINDLKYTTVLKTNNDNYSITINKEDLYGVINDQDSEIIKNKYSYIEYLFGEYFIAAKEDGYLGIINSSDETVIDFKYDVLQKIDNTNVVEAKILKQNKSDLYSENLENIYSASNVSVYVENEYIKAYTNNETKYFNFDGNEISNDEVFKNNKLLASKKDGKWGFVDRNSDVVIDYKYDKVTEFNSYGYAGIMKNNKWGVIDGDGNIIQEPTYKIEPTNTDPEFLGKYYKVYYGYGESYYTNK